LLSVSLPPCCRYHPAGVGQPFQPVLGCPCCLRPQDAGSASGAPHFRGHLCVYFRYRLVIRCHPSDDFVDRLQSFGFPRPCYPSYGASGSYPGRTVFLLNTPALAGHTSWRALFSHRALHQCYLDGGSPRLYPNGGVCTNAKRPAFFTSTGAGGRKMRGGVLSFALVGLSQTGNSSFRAYHRGLCSRST